MTPELDAEYRSGLTNALEAGWRILDNGGSALDAVETAVSMLEDFPLFNAGRGSVFTHEGKNEMDASIMDGSRLKAGAIAFVKNVKNPIKLARMVMENTEHVLLAGAGANEFALQMNAEMADDAYFFTQHRYDQLLQARAEGKVVLDHNAAEPEKVLEEAAPTNLGVRPAHKGTVGAVACDSSGQLAAATSTGGMTNKKFGRIGDTPIVGAGTYADDRCAVSCTGHGEYFMLGVTAFDVAARMKYLGLDLITAASETIEHLTTIKGEGGLIAVDVHGNVTLPFNSDGMYRGFINREGKVETHIYA
jgi:L-asparaginase / beta-aspartyl-peptidase